MDSENEQKPQPCPYFPESGLSAEVDLIESGTDPHSEYTKLLGLGYRRIGDHFYAARCADCSACIPIRLAPEAFSPSRSQRRTLRRNTDIRIELRSPVVDDRRLDLYESYLASKHPGGQHHGRQYNEAVLTSIHYGYPATMEMDYYIGSRLACVGIVDETQDALSANYFYYDTGVLDRRPGIFSILMEIEVARRLGKRLYYMGYWIEGSGKMSYKADFRPHELLMDGRWLPRP